MEAKIAVATVSGRAYYFLVNELKARGMDFLITTAKECKFIKHPQVLVYQEDQSAAAIVDEAAKLVRGKKIFETVAVGVDPGKTFGVAVLSDGNVLETFTCISLEEAANAVADVFTKHQAAVKVVKVGNLAPVYTAELLPLLDKILPSDIAIEVVREAGTSRLGSQTIHKRRLRHAMAAVKIAERRGNLYQRKGATHLQ